jgi:hypothetical protein
MSFNKYTRSWLSVTLLLLSFVLAAQSDQTGTIQGQLVSSADGAIIDYASVALNREGGSTIDFQLTDETGTFQFTNVPEGDYRLLVTRLSFEDYKSEIISVTAGGTFEVSPKLTSQANTLSVVEVTSSRPVIAFSRGKMVVAVDQLPSAASSNSLEILNKVPGISVRGKSITLNGFGNVSVLINGRKRTMTASQAATLLESIPADNIRSIEVTSGKSVSQDASGTGGEINIVTKRAMDQFFNLSLNNRIRVDRYLSNSHSAYINLNQNRLRINGGASFARNFSYGTSVRAEKYTTSADEIIGTGITNGTDNYLSNLPSANLSLEYDLSERNRVGATTYAYFTNKKGGSTDINNYSFTGQEDQEFLFNETQRLNDNLSSADIYFERDLDTLKSSFKTSLSYLTGYSQEQLDFERRDPPTVSAAEAGVVRADLPLNGGQFSFRADLEKNLSESSQFSLGIKVSDGEIRNFATYDTISFQPPRRNLGLSDSLSYREQVYAAYASFAKDVGAFSIKGGARIESTRASARSFKVNETSSQAYTNLFPNLSINYNAGANYKFSLNYSSSITRPNYLQLNPYVRYLDAYTYTTGNNQLLPQIDHRVTFNTRLFRMLHLNFGYIHGSNYVGNVRRLEADGRTTKITTANAFDVRAAYGQAIIYYRLGQDGRLSGQFTSLIIPLTYHAIGDAEDQAAFTGSDTKVSFSASTQFKVTKRFSIDADYFFSRGRLTFQQETANRWELNAGARYKLPGDAFTVSARVSDIFNTDNAAGNRFFTNYSATYGSDFNTRRLTIAVNYRLGKLKKNYQQGPTGVVGRYKD